MNGILGMRLLRMASLRQPPLRFLPVCAKFNDGRAFHTNCSNLGFFGPPQEEGFMKRVAKRLGWTETHRSVLRASGYLMYIKVADEVDYKNFFKYCNLPDTFVSWFTVMELHIWMLSARLMEEGEEGKIVRNSMIRAMWEDCDTRSKKLEGALSSARKKQINQLNEQFQASLIAFDEGLLGSDKVLAGALWRRFLKDSEEPKKGNELLKEIIAIEMLVMYVRSQFYNLHKLGREQLVRRRAFVWSPFDRTLFDTTTDLQEIKTS